ncbi:MAG: fibronectin type III domain-containing protein [Ruminococcus sp.]
MKISKKVICTALAVLMALSAVAVGGFTVSAASVKAPKKVQSKNIVNGIKITWSKVSKADSYQVFRGSKKIATTKSTAYTDAVVKAGKNYVYKVKAVDGKKVSSAKSAKKITRMNMMLFSDIKNVTNGVKLSWSGRKGADKYVVYRKTTGSYKKIASTTAKSYTDKNVVSGTKYTYKLTAVASKTKSEAYRRVESFVALDPVSTVTARQNLSMDGISLNWSSVKGATSYAVYRQKCTESGYKKIATVNGTTYNDKSAAANNPTAYGYTVVAVKGSCESAKTTMRLAPYVPKDEGDNRYYYDNKHDAHIKLYFNTGDVYAEGKALADFLSLGGMYEEEITDGADVVALENSVITAKKAGTAVVKITLSDAAMNLVNGLANNGVTALSNNTIYLEITVK